MCVKLFYIFQSMKAGVLGTIGSRAKALPANQMKEEFYDNLANGKYALIGDTAL